MKNVTSNGDRRMKQLIAEGRLEDWIWTRADEKYLGIFKLQSSLVGSSQSARKKYLLTL